MKKTDIALIILIAAISVGLSWWIGNAVLTNPDDSVVTLDYMPQIGSTLDEPNIINFNTYAPNPTVEVYVGKCPYGQKWDESKKSCITTLVEDDEDTKKDK
jgi:hypothetical protein